MVISFINFVRQWHRERRAIEALAQLSDERLNDIGLSRGNLARSVRYGLRG